MAVLRRRGTAPREEGGEREDASRAAGDLEAFTRLAAALEARLYRSALVLCGEREEARDLVQETLLAVYRGLPRFAGRSSPATFAGAVMLKLHRRRLRHRLRQKRTAPAPGRLPARLGGDRLPPEPFLDDAGREMVRSALAALDPRFQAVLVLKYVEELSVREIARELNLDEGTVKSRLFRAREALRRRIDASPLPRGGA